MRRQSGSASYHYTAAIPRVPRVGGHKGGILCTCEISIYPSSKKTDDGNKIRENYYHLFAIYKFDDDILCEYFVTIHSMETACQIHFSLSLFSPSAAKFHQDQCIVRS